MPNKSRTWSELSRRIWENAREMEKYKLSVVSFPGFWNAAYSDAEAYLLRSFGSALRYMTNVALANESDPIATLKLRSDLSDDMFYVSLQDEHLLEINGALWNRILSFARTLFRGYARLEKILISDASRLSLDESQPIVISTINSLGDLHGDGDCVRRLSFSTGESRIFKPRAAYMEQVIGELLDKLRRDIDLAVHVPQSIFSNEDHSWWIPLEFIRKIPAFDTRFAKFFARSYGHTVGLAALLGFEDLHYENVCLLPNGEMAVLDCETAFSTRGLVSESLSSRWGALANTTLRSGLIPSIRIRGDEIADDSILTSLLVESQAKRCHWQSNSTSEFFPITTLMSVPESFTKEFSESAQAALVAFSGAVARCKDVRGYCRTIFEERRRFIYRPTRFYQRLISNAINLEAFAEKSFEDVLWHELFESTVDGAVNPVEHLEMCKKELQDLRHGVVPIFMHQRDTPLSLWSFPQIESYIALISQQEQWREVEVILGAALRSYAELIFGFDVRNQTSTYSGSESEDEVLSFFERISNNCAALSSGQIFAFDVLPVGLASILSLGPSGLGLYRGASGLGITLWAAEKRGFFHPSFSSKDFFITLGEYIGRGQLEALGEEVGWSMADGVAGIAYAACITGQYSPDVLLDELDKVFEEKSLQSLDWDYVNGTAGILACYCAIARRATPRATYHVIEKLAENMSRRIDSAGVLCSMLPTQRGLAHGLPGAWYALDRARSFVPLNTFDELINQYRTTYFSLLFEQSDAHAWPNAGAWCGGGIGVLRAELRMADCNYVATAQKLKPFCVGHSSPVRQVCCGLQGQELLVYEEQLHICGHSDWQISAEVISYDQLPNAFACLGFFQGIAGPLYYQLQAKNLHISVEMAD